MDETKRIGALAFILERLAKVRGRLYYGSVIVQKVVYFLVRGFGVKLPYEFYFYHFGPYSDALNRDLSLMEMSGIVIKDFDPTGSGYSTKLNKNNTKEYVDSASVFTSKHLEKIKKAIEIFGQKFPPELELLATIHFVQDNNTGESKKNILKKVKNLKPKYSIEEISESYDFLEEHELV